MKPPPNPTGDGPPVVELTVEASGPSRRRGEPVRCGLPWPRGLVADARHLRIRDESGAPVALQARALDRWPDGSVRWALLDWKADVDGAGRYRVGVARPGEDPEPARDPLRVAETGDGGVDVDTGKVSVRLRAGHQFPLGSVEVRGGAAAGPTRVRLTVVDEAGRRHEPQVDRVVVEESGPVRAVVGFEGRLVAPGAPPLAEVSGSLHFVAGSATVGFVLTIGNPRRAVHPGNCWDLGDPGSIHLRDVSLEVIPPRGDGPPSVLCAPEREADLERFGTDFELYQDSSGGENWRSTNHVNRHGVVPTTFRGYRLRGGGPERRGLRASPVVVLEQAGTHLAVAMRHFWENFPKAIEVADGALRLRLFPGQSADTHELQGGEQKTHDFVIAFAADDVTDRPLDWCRSPALPHAAPAWYCASGAIPYLTPRAEDPNTLYLELVDAAIEGPDTLARKREVIDEYGWRHFGEIYGDHEAVFHDGPGPLVSHYNNQYDAVAGLASQYLRSGEARWWHAMDELARHVLDIDIYHTSLDKSAYNGGMFWHTRHYVDAGTSTHRTYPRAHGGGGGPSGGHLYATGLLLHHFLTGDPRSRAAVVGLGRYVIEADDGRRTVFRWLSRGATGYPTESVYPGYHGPGRAAANSIAALLDAHVAAGAAEFLAKAEQLIRRCIHPAGDPAAHNLLDAERRWFYTMFLQALGRYLDHKAGLEQLDAMYAYAQASLLGYARWMATHEVPYLDRPEQLEYPTETWAAQDMRKSEVFKYAAKHAAGAERALFLERSDFFFRAATTTLGARPTRTLARPVVLLLSNGLMHAYFQHHPDVAAPRAEAAGIDFGRPEAFVAQKVRAKRRFLILTTAMVLGGLAGLLGLMR